MTIIRQILQLQNILCAKKEKQGIKVKKTKQKEEELVFSVDI
jgi:hypothetical protein